MKAKRVGLVKRCDEWDSMEACLLFMIKITIITPQVESLRFAKYNAGEELRNDSISAVCHRRKFL